MAAKPEVLEWAGSHLGVVFSPDNKFLVTAMHEPALHGWRLADNRHMRMTGYPGRVRSMSWSAGGKALATSGADTVIMWPFASKDGPMGKEPAMLAPLQARVSAVACHPKQDILAAGYSDGTVLMVRLNDGAEILVRRQRRRGGRGAGLERQRHAAGICRRGWRRRVAGVASLARHFRRRSGVRFSVVRHPAAELSCSVRLADQSHGEQATAQRDAMPATRTTRKLPETPSTPRMMDPRFEEGSCKPID